MTDLNEVDSLDKKLSELTTISESHNVTKHFMKWLVPKSELKKNIAIVGGYIESNWIYKENVKYYYLVFYPNGQNDSTRGKTSIKIVFYEEISENSYIEGNICMSNMCVFTGENLNIAKDFNVESFTKQSVVEFIDNRICSGNDELIIHCSLTHNIHYVECKFDDRIAFSKQIEKNDNILKCLLGLSDVTFKFKNNQKCDAVKALLFRVPYFRKLFDENDNKDSFDLTEIDIRKHVFDNFLYYLYTKNLPLLDFKLAYELYILAQYFEFSDLKNLCSTYLTVKLNVKNVLIVLRISHMWHDLTLKKKCFEFIKESNPDTLARESIMEY